MASADIDWGLIGKPPDFVGDYANAFSAGQALGQAAAKASNALEPAEDNGKASKLGIAAAAMNPSERQAAATRADAVGALLRGLAGASADPAERLAMARHVAARTPGLGIDPAAIRPEDLTDQGLASHLASVTALQSLLQAPGVAMSSASSGAPAAA